MSRFSLLKKINVGGLVEKNVSLTKYTTFKIGGNSKYLVTIKTLEGFLKVMNYIQKEKIEYFVLGAGSNLLVSDRGFDGIVILLDGDFSRSTIIDTGVEFGAGIRLVDAFVFSRGLGLSGFEILGGIPGTIGGAVYMNAGAYGMDMSQVVDYVVAYVNGKICYFENGECLFDYRQSVFQRNGAIILRVGCRLTPKEKDKIQSEYFRYLMCRKESQPLEYPSAGSVFKRVDGLNISAMLDEMGVKGMSEGGAKVSTKHANFIISENATARDVYMLICKIKKLFNERYGIKLQTEIKFLGDFYEIDR